MASVPYLYRLHTGYTLRIGFIVSLVCTLFTVQTNSTKLSRQYTAHRRGSRGAEGARARPAVSLRQYELVYSRLARKQEFLVNF